MASKLKMMGLVMVGGALMLAACGDDAATVAASSSATSSGNGGAGGSGISLGGFDASGGGSSFEGCATTTAESERLPLDMVVMLDQSGSMVGPKWDALKAALEVFVSNEEVADFGLGLQFFPIVPGTCNYLAYANLEVPIALASENTQLVVDTLINHSPGGETPTLPALQGAIERARLHAVANPDRRVVVVLATDGEPSVCGSNIDNVAQVAANGFANYDVPTFVIGVGKELTVLDTIAMSGGTESAFFVDTNSQSLSGDLAAALDQIRGAALPCEYAIPAVDDLDFGLVNVVYTPAEGEAITIPRVLNKADCATTTQAWHYDDSANPSKIVLCEQLCEAANDDTEARIEVVFGCKTIIA